VYGTILVHLQDRGPGVANKYRSPYARSPIVLAGDGGRPAGETGSDGAGGCLGTWEDADADVEGCGFEEVVRVGVGRRGRGLVSEVDSVLGVAIESGFASSGM